MSKMCCFSTSLFSCFGLDFGASWANLGPNSMCCARTAALQGDEKERRLKRIGVPATINASCHPSACAKNVSKNLPPKPSQALLEGPQEGPKLVKNRPRCPRGVQETPKSVQEASKKRPRGAQERPRVPKRRPRAPKRRPRHVQEAPKRLQNRAW